ncbi:MAG TPA: DNA-formamidopyrimidine glycosylase family protein [Alphaproteobacteria bacterium]|nr:DNA-formamidopyrimidine glycosylase family protein [Alphaproteobacteria bacterium]
MPELPDVEMFARQIRDHGLKRRIDAVDLRDPKRLKGASAGKLEAALRGHAFSGVERHGKLLFAGVDGGGHLAMHFGMTGFVAFYDDPGDEPAHARLVLRFDDGGHFAFDDQRRIGWLALVDDVAGWLREQELGPDALDVDLAALRRLFEGKRGMVKPALMDQQAIAGIGNVYSDEILFQAGIRPDRKVAELDDAAVEAIHQQMRAVLRAAADHDADPEKMPEDWLTPHRGSDDPCPRCGGSLEAPKISGRTAWLCPRCQH